VYPDRLLTVLAVNGIDRLRVLSALQAPQAYPRQAGPEQQHRGRLRDRVGKFSMGVSLFRLTYFTTYETKNENLIPLRVHEKNIPPLKGMERYMA
jgi:hypothetical protein